MSSYDTKLLLLDWFSATSNEVQIPVFRTSINVDMLTKPPISIKVWMITYLNMSDSIDMATSAIYKRWNNSYIGSNCYVIVRNINGSMLIDLTATSTGVIPFATTNSNVATALTNALAVTVANIGVLLTITWNAETSKFSISSNQSFDTVIDFRPVIDITDVRIMSAGPPIGFSPTLYTVNSHQTIVGDRMINYATYTPADPLKEMFVYVTSPLFYAIDNGNIPINNQKNSRGIIGYTTQYQGETILGDETDTAPYLPIDSRFSKQFYDIKSKPRGQYDNIIEFPYRLENMYGNYISILYATRKSFSPYTTSLFITMNFNDNNSEFSRII